MDIALLKANVSALRGFVEGVPTIDYDATCGCFEASAMMTDELRNDSLANLRSRLFNRAMLTRNSVQSEIPELSKPGGSDLDFRMTFSDLHKNPQGLVDGIRDFAEYVDGKIVLK